MHRRRVTIAAATVFAIGAAFAAEPTSMRADWGEASAPEQLSWTPGSGSVMSAHEPNQSLLAAPR
jgi:hypothetical protein